jgi:hypothetical protein
MNCELISPPHPLTATMFWTNASPPQTTSVTGGQHNWNFKACIKVDKSEVNESVNRWYQGGGGQQVWLLEPLVRNSTSDLAELVYTEGSNNSAKQCRLRWWISVSYTDFKCALCWFTSVAYTDSPVWATMKMAFYTLIYSILYTDYARTTLIKINENGIYTLICSVPYTDYACTTLIKIVQMSRHRYHTDSSISNISICSGLYIYNSLLQRHAHTWARTNSQVHNPHNNSPSWWKLFSILLPLPPCRYDSLVVVNTERGRLLLTWLELVWGLRSME